MKNNENINQNQVQSSKEWFKKFITPRKSLNIDFNTYQLKHCAARSAGGYISLDSFKQAVLELGYVMNKNGYINADYSLAKKNFRESMINKPY